MRLTTGSDLCKVPAVVPPSGCLFPVPCRHVPALDLLFHRRRDSPPAPSWSPRGSGRLRQPPRRPVREHGSHRERLAWEREHSYPIIRFDQGELRRRHRAEPPELERQCGWRFGQVESHLLSWSRRRPDGDGERDRRAVARPARDLRDHL